MDYAYFEVPKEPSLNLYPVGTYEFDLAVEKVLQALEEINEVAKHEGRNPPSMVPVYHALVQWTNAVTREDHHG